LIEIIIIFLYSPYFDVQVKVYIYITHKKNKKIRTRGRFLVVMVRVFLDCVWFLFIW